MKRWTELASAQAPDGSTLTLAERDNEYVMRVDGRELMSTRHSFSEEQLAVVGCALVKARPGARVLIGGLGLGFTLRAALESLGADAQVVVAELLAPVVTWNENPAYPLSSAALADRRTRVIIGDVDHVIQKSKAGFDAILLDADNQTTRMNTAGNDRLYQDGGLSSIHRALRKGGCVVYWSAGSEPQLAKRLGKAGFEVEVQRVRKHRTSGGHHMLTIGRRG